MQERGIVLTGFVLRHHLLGEADKIAVLFTRERGLRRAVAKGVRRPKSALAGRLEPFNENRIELLKGRNLDKIIQLDGHRRFPQILEDLNVMATAMAAMELLLGLLEVDDPHPEVYDAFVELLQALHPGSPCEVLFITFELHLLSALGYRPALAGCCRCDTTFSHSLPATMWDAEGGGTVCAPCSAKSPQGLRRLPLGAWQLLRRLQHTSIQSAQAVRGAPNVLQQARQTLTSYTAARTDRELRARKMFDWAPTT